MPLLLSKVGDELLVAVLLLVWGVFVAAAHAQVRDAGFELAAATLQLDQE